MRINRDELLKSAGYLGGALLAAGYLHYSINEVLNTFNKTPMVAGAVLLIVAAVFNFVNYHQVQSLRTSAELGLVGFEACEQTNFGLLVTVGTDPRSARLSLRVSADPAALSAGQIREYADASVRITVGNRQSTRAVLKALRPFASR